MCDFFFTSLSAQLFASLHPCVESEAKNLIEETVHQEKVQVIVHPENTRAIRNAMKPSELKKKTHRNPLPRCILQLKSKMLLFGRSSNDGRDAPNVDSVFHASQAKSSQIGKILQTPRSPPLSKGSPRGILER